MGDDEADIPIGEEITVALAVDVAEERAPLHILVVCGPGGLPDAAKARFEALREAGATVTVQIADDPLRIDFVPPAGMVWLDEEPNLFAQAMEAVFAEQDRLEANPPRMLNEVEYRASRRQMIPLTSLSDFGGIFGSSFVPRLGKPWVDPDLSGETDHQRRTRERREQRAEFERMKLRLGTRITDKSRRR